MLTGDCNVCINGKLPSYSATCVECGLSRKNYKPITNEDRIRNGYYIASDACGRDKNGKFVCVCGKCRVVTNQEADGDNH